MSAPQWKASVPISSPGLSVFCRLHVGEIPWHTIGLRRRRERDFSLAVLLAVLALLVRYAHLAIPVVSSHSFETLLVGFLLLLAGNLFKGF